MAGPVMPSTGFQSTTYSRNEARAPLARDVEKPDAEQEHEKGPPLKWLPNVRLLAPCEVHDARDAGT
jgi:hypothetical protein